MENDALQEHPQKFTRGEKCVFVHLIATFSIFLLLIIVYFIHLCLVVHSYRDVWKVSLRRSGFNESNDVVELEKVPVGIVYISSDQPMVVCNSVLLREKWSVAPGHCTAMRTDPDLFTVIHLWRIKYKNDGVFKVSEIKRTIPHPHFDRSDFRNNIGLIEHVTPIKRDSYYAFPSGLQLNDETLEKYSNSMLIIGWQRNSTENIANEDSRLHYIFVKPVSTTKCNQFMSPIVDLRSYEYCILFNEKTDGSFPDHGSVLIVNMEILGIFAWGEKSGRGAPSIIIDHNEFKNWTENIIVW